MNDSELIKEVLSGNTNVFKYLVDKYSSIVFRTCLGYVHCKEEAEDLTQEVFISAYKSLDKFKGEASFSTWLFRIAVNKSINHLRGKHIGIFRRIFTDPYTSDIKNEYHNVKSSELTPEERLIENEKSGKIRKALSQLPENQRSAIVLSKYNDLSQKEIADILNKTEGAVEALIQRAKGNLRKYLNEK